MIFFITFSKHMQVRDLFLYLFVYSFIHSYIYHQCVARIMSASAKRRGITPQLFAAWGRTQERTVAACPIRPRTVLHSVVHRRQRFKFDTAVMRQKSVLRSSDQQYVDRIC